MGVYSLRDCGNSFVRRALIECSFSSFDKALDIVDQGLNEFPECGDLYVVQVMAERKLVDESQLQFASLVDFRPLGQSDAFQRALRFASPELRQLLRYYERSNDEFLANWVVLDRFIPSFILDNAVTIMSKRAKSLGYSSGYERPSELQRNDDKYSQPGNFIVWSKHPVRLWLNDGYKRSLPRYLSSRLVTRHIHTKGYDAPLGGSVPSDDVDDEIFILDSWEAIRLPDDILRAENDRLEFEGLSTWWLRDPTLYMVDEPWYNQGKYCMRHNGIRAVYGMQTISGGIWGSAFGARAGKLFPDSYDVQVVRPAMTLSTDVDLSKPEVADTFPQLRLHSLADVSGGVRDHIVFGGFLWRVLDVRDGCALLLSEHCMQMMPVRCGKWSGSSFRAWLNGEFYNSLDIESKDDVVLTTSLKTPNVSDGAVEFYEGTEDKVFLLSFEEVVRYLRGGEYDRKTFNEEYRNAPWNERDNLLLPSCSATFNSMPSGWLLRSGTVCQGADKSMEAIDERGWYSTVSQKQRSGIRPAMWVKLP